jgi:hypothetical protein
LGNGIDIEKFRRYIKMIIYNILIENPDSTNLNSFSTLDDAYDFCVRQIEKYKMQDLFVLPKLEDVYNHLSQNYKVHQNYFCLTKNIKHGFWFHLLKVSLDEIKQSPGFSTFDKYHQEKSEAEVFNVSQFLMEQGFEVKTQDLEKEAWNKCMMKLKGINSL